MAAKVLILGIGNLLWADEGFGVRAVEQLDCLFEFNQDIKLLDGGTQGIYLVQHVENCDILVVFDTIDYGLPPGTLKLIEGDEVPKYMGAKKMSLHQTGFQEVLAMAEMLGKYPEHLLLIGVQPAQLEDYGGSLTEITRQQIEPAIQASLNWLKQFNVHARKRQTPLAVSELLAGREMSIKAYEEERPAPETACRVGDERVLKSKYFEVGYRAFPLDPEQSISCDVDHRGKY